MNSYIFQHAVLRLTYEVGIDNNGKPQTKSKSYRNLKAGQSAEKIAAVASALAGLSIYPLATIDKTETNEVVVN